MKTKTTLSVVSTSTPAVVSGFTLGLDLGDRQHHVCVLDAAGQIVREASLPNTRPALARLLADYPHATIALEAGTHSPWISRYLTDLGATVLVANPRKLHAISRNERKCDRRDAQMLARLARVDAALLYPIQHGSAQPDALGQAETAALRGEPLPLAPELFPLAAQGAAWFFRLGRHPDEAHGLGVTTKVAVQLQGQFPGVRLVGHHPFMLRVEFDRMHHECRHAQGRELAMQVEAAGPGFVNHEHLVRLGKLFLHEQQEAGGCEPLRRLRRLAIAHPHHPELIRVPIDSELELLDSVLRLRMGRRIRFHRHV